MDGRITFVKRILSNPLDTKLSYKDFAFLDALRKSTADARMLPFYGYSTPEDEHERLILVHRYNEKLWSRREVETGESPYIFRKDTETWTLRFNGGEVKKGVKDIMALADIQYLLQHQNEDIEILSLPKNLGMEPRAESVPIATQGDNDDLKEQINEYQERFKYTTDQDVRNEYKQTICDLQKQQNQNFDKFGESRQLAGDLAKIIRATKERVDRFIRKLMINDEPILPELGIHLENFLKIDEICNYHPETAID